MKAFIAVKNNNGIESQVDDRFGRSGYFVIYDLDQEKILFIEENRYRQDGHGVGIAVGNHVVECGCELAIGAQPGPKAEMVLRKGNVNFFRVENCSVRQALEKYKEYKEGN
jgi:predicted Fe-Mo cluster-binding NifX family protein